MRTILLIILGLSTFVYADYSRSNGVVTDSKSTLQWQDDYSDNGGIIKNTTWTEAIDYCERLSLDGGNWRLPNKKELHSVVDYSVYNPSISSAFTSTSTDHYWSSTTYPNNTDSSPYDTHSAFVVYFYYGRTDAGSKGNSNYVRCVRAGE